MHDQNPSGAIEHDTAHSSINLVWLRLLRLLPESYQVKDISWPYKERQMYSQNY